MQTAVVSHDAVDFRIGAIEQKWITGEVCRHAARFGHQKGPGADIPLMFGPAAPGSISLAGRYLGQLIGDTAYDAQVELVGKWFKFAPVDLGTAGRYEGAGQVAVP